MLSQTAEYALRSVVVLAANPDRRLTKPEIAERTRTPAGYQSKVLQALSRAGIVASHRGPGGGFELARSPSELTLLEVVSAVTRIERIEHCPLQLAEHTEQLCGLHRLVDAVIVEVVRVLGDVTIAEVIMDQCCAGPLCSAFRASESPAMNSLA